MQVSRHDNKKGRTLWLVLFFILFLPLSGWAEEKTRSKWGLGLGTGWLNDYPGSAQGRIRFLPFPVYRGTLVKLDRVSGVSGGVFNSSRINFSWNFIFQFPTNSSSIPARAGMPNLDWLLSLGPQVKYSIYRTPYSHTFFRFPVRVNTCTNFSTRTQFCGLNFSPGVRHAMRFEKWGDLTLRWEAFSNTSEYQQYFYQVDPKYATATRPAYHARAGFLGFVYGFFHTLPFEGWDLSTAVSLYDYSLAINQKSPLFVHKTNFSIFFAVVFDISNT